ncbi:MAG: hypothetical protein V1820_03135 [archaeon]
MVYLKKSALLPASLICASVAVLLLVLSPGLSLLSVSKGVFGTNSTVDFGERVNVRVSVLSSAPVKLDRLEDPLPPEFSPINLPPSCSFSSGTVFCPFGYEANNFTIEYSAVAVGAGQKVVFHPAKLYYYSEDGLPESRASNEIDGVFYVGRALLNLTISIKEVDGVEVLQPYLLPGSLFKVGVSVRNSGALPAEEVSLHLPSPAGWNLTSGRVSSAIGTLRSGESQGVVAVFRAPALGENFTEGALDLNYTATWKDSFGKVGRAEFPLLVFLSKADVSAKRTVELKWRRTEVGELQALLEVTIELKNRGTAESLISISQGVPGNVEKSAIVSALTLPGNEEKKLSAVSLVSGDKVVVPAGFANYSDARGNKYPGHAFPAEEIKIETSIWAKVYQMTDKFFPIGQLVALVVFAGGIFFLPSAGKNSYLLLALVAALLVSLLVLVSTAIVWFGF